MDIEEFQGLDGEIRRPGSLILPEGFVSSFPPYAGDAETPVWEDKDIKRVISDPNRRDITKVVPFSVYGTNQGSTSACNGWAGANAVTVTRKLTGIDDGWVGSGSYVYSKINGGRDNGSMLEDGLKAIQTYGVASRKTVPSDSIYTSQYPKSADVEAKDNRGLQCYRVTSKQAFRTALAIGWVGIVAMHVGNKFVNFRGTGVAPLANGKGNHAVLVTDLRLVNGTEHYITDNSWGISWGDTGRCRLVWDHFAQTFTTHAFYVVPGVRSVT